MVPPTEVRPKGLIDIPLDILPSYPLLRSTCDKCNYSDGESDHRDDDTSHTFGSNVTIVLK